MGTADSRRVKHTSVLAAGCGALLAVVGFSLALEAQTIPQTSSVVEPVRAWRKANEHRIVRELTDLLAFPNVAADTPNIQRNAAKLREMLERRGVRARLLPIRGRGPVVFGELVTPGAARTVIFYCHYDGQPVDPSRWQETQPFEPALRTDAFERGGKLIPFPAEGTLYQDDWRIYARSASDDKSPIVTILSALDALRASKIPLAVNVKFVFDGEEEDGSPNLEKTLLAHRELLTADVLISADGPVHQSGRPQVVFGNRGVLDMEITVYGPNRNLHSGHYGNWAPNPAMLLAQLLATMKGKDGRVLVEGFYDDVVPLTATERRALAEAPANEPELMREFAFAAPERSGSAAGGLAELITLPSLNVDGLRSGYVGAESRTIVPDHAIAALDLRLVKNVLPQRQFERMVAHIRKQGYYVTSQEPTPEERSRYPRIARVRMNGGYPAARISMDQPVAQAVLRAVEGAVGPVVKLPTSGGSVPMHIFENLGLPVIHVPIVNHDNHQHSENENLRLGNFWRGMEIFAALLAELHW